MIQCSSKQKIKFEDATIRFEPNKHEFVQLLGEKATVLTFCIDRQPETKGEPKHMPILELAAL